MEKTECDQSISCRCVECDCAWARRYATMKAESIREKGTGLDLQKPYHTQHEIAPTGIGGIYRGNRGSP